MRPEEIFALNHLVTLIGGSYRDGEDPPDAYIDLPGRVVAVEVTRLIEPMLNGSKINDQSRLAGDSPADMMMSDLYNQFKDKIPVGKILLVMIATPINNVRKIKGEIKLHIDEVLGLGYANRLINMNADAASITIHDTDCDTQGRMEYGIFNEDVSADIGENLIYSLGERIRAKTDLPGKHHVGSEYWLCIINEIWLASSHLVQLAFAELGATHNYDQIYVVHGHGEVQHLIEPIN
ncbi:hypothetical protein [Granulosicoccus antarcticus]|uniref:Uncharacterized protein n=1 Tax=Granulosicoccus antarcticus IMCC3135 TaxID=1192854 RepID=A0A2Z2NIQ3_9GAMM|nr:hypothetical protein [Granulosicoccus antarcticus]ASJ70365.1 hypothetical protein IMCC3135_01230 [Granulosicoccus antarcticus IMCC3135]